MSTSSADFDQAETTNNQGERSMNASTATQELFTCPACDRPVMGTLSLTFETGPVKEKSVEMSAQVTGLRVSHDCVPKATRSGGFLTDGRGQVAMNRGDE